MSQRKYNIMGHLSFPRNVFINGPTTFNLLENQSFSRPKKTIIEDKYEKHNIQVVLLNDERDWFF